MTEPVVLSGSSVNTYLRCGHQWYLAYVMQLKQPPNVRQVLGIAAHSAVEHNMAQKVASHTDVSLLEMTEVFSDNFDSLAVDIEYSDEPTGVAKDDGVALVKLHREKVSPNIQPVMVEEAGQLTVNDIPFSWTVDLVDSNGVVRDLKTSKYRPTLEKHMLQLTGYALGFRERTGQIESGVAIDGLVRTKVPVYTELLGETVNDRRVGSFASTLESVYDSINAGAFPPNGLNNGACSWCGFAQACKYQKK